MDYLMLLIGCLYAFFACIVLFILCELSQRSCDAFNNIDTMIEQWNWYLLPIKIQQILPLIFIIMQHPAKITCFGSISCNRDTFKNVSNYKSKLCYTKPLTIISKSIFRWSIKRIRISWHCAILAIEIYKKLVDGSAS